jgi:glycosyltransferase involved in cell wall biosynthesis
MPLSVLEAMASFIPVVASAIPGNTDLVEDGVTGLLFQVGSIHDLKNKLVLLIEDDKLASTITKKAFKQINNNNNIINRTNKILKIYEMNILNT